MFNIILDRLPNEYHGYLIRTSFRIGIQISLCLQDVDYTEEEQIAIALDLLYGKGIPTDIDEAIQGLNWFLSCGDPDLVKPSGGSQKPLFYWDFDSARIYSSFLKTYGIDITKEDMHWFRFIDLIGSLDKDCSFNQAVQIRGYDMSGMKGKARIEMQKMKQSLTPEVQLTQEEKDQLAFFESLSGGDVNG